MKNSIINFYNKIRFASRINKINKESKELWPLFEQFIEKNKLDQLEKITSTGFMPSQTHLMSLMSCWYRLKTNINYNYQSDGSIKKQIDESKRYEKIILNLYKNIKKNYAQDSTEYAYINKQINTGYYIVLKIFKPASFHVYADGDIRCHSTLRGYDEYKYSCFYLLCMGIKDLKLEKSFILALGPKLEEIQNQIDKNEKMMKEAKVITQEMIHVSEINQNFLTIIKKLTLNHDEETNNKLIEISKNSIDKTVDLIKEEITSALSADEINKINQIQNYYLESLNMDLEQSIRHRFESIHEKEITYLVKKYKSIPDEYKKEFKNAQGKTASDLFSSSLDNMLNYMQEHLKKLKLETVEEDLRDLKVRHNYIRETLK